MGKRLDRMANCLINLPAYGDDRAVVSMTQQQEGAFFRLLRKMWGQPIPGVIEADDDDYLRALTGTTVEDWPATRKALERYYDTTSKPGYWIDDLMVESYRTQTDHHEKQSVRGKAGARKRWDPDAAIAALSPKHNGSVLSCSALHSAALGGVGTTTVSGDNPAGTERVTTETLLTEYWSLHPKPVDAEKTAAAWISATRGDLTIGKQIVAALQWFIANKWPSRRLADIANSHYFITSKRWKEAYGEKPKSRGMNPPTTVY